MSERAPRILIVEDEILIALELEGLLQDEGYEAVGIAGSRDEAASLTQDLQAQELRPDLALVDIHLADGATGIEVARELVDEGVRVLFMSANTKRLPYDMAGACGAIAKPYTERVVRHAIRYVLEGGEGEPPERFCRSPLWRPDLLDLEPANDLLRAAG